MISPEQRAKIRAEIAMGMHATPGDTLELLAAYEALEQMLDAIVFAATIPEQEQAVAVALQAREAQQGGVAIIAEE